MKPNPFLCVMTAALLICFFIPAVSATDEPGILGEPEWQKVLGGCSTDYGQSVQQTGDGGYVVSGTTWSGNCGEVGANHGGADVWVVKLTSNGTMAWQKVLGGSNSDYGDSIQQTSDGGYIVTGETYSDNSGDVGANHGNADVWVIKLTSTGAIAWQKVLGGSSYDIGRSIRQTRDGGYIIAGETYSGNSGNVGASHGGADVWVVKLTSAGAIAWQKVLGGTGDDMGYSVHQTSEGGYIITGYTSSGNSGDVGVNNGGADVWVVKLTSTGAITWQKVLGGAGGDVGKSIRQTSDGGYILTGYTSSGNSGDVGVNNGGADVWVAKLTSTGTIVWQKLLGGTGDDYGYSIQQTGNGGYILAGYTNSDNSGDVRAGIGGADVWVVKLTSTGTIVWQKLLGGTEDDYGRSIQLTSDGGYIAAGYTNSGSLDEAGTSKDGAKVWVVKLHEVQVIPLPGYTNPPTDPDGDGIYEDLNGNGRLDFADVVLSFNQMEWIVANEPVSAFDLNGNGRIDFADMVRLFGDI